MNRPPKICMLAKVLPPYFGGAARQALSLSHQLAKEGVSIFFLTARMAPLPAREDLVDGLRVILVPHVEVRKWGPLKKLIGMCLALYCHRHDFEILHIHAPDYISLTAGGFAQLFLKKRVLLKLTSIHCDTPSGLKKRQHPRIAWYFYRRADAVVCMSTSQYQDCQSHGFDKSRLHKIPNGVQIDCFRPVATPEERAEQCCRLGLSPDWSYVTFIGSIEENKGICCLVKTAIEVCSRRADVKFLLIGPDGRNSTESNIEKSFVEKIREMIHHARMDDRILLLGRKDNTADFLRASSVFVFPSRSEGFGTVLIEAMATELPVVTLDIPGVTTDIVTSGHDGEIIPNEDPGAFADAVVRFFDNPSLARQMGQAARQTVVERFTLPAVAARYGDLYRRLITARRS